MADTETATTAGQDEGANEAGGPADPAGDQEMAGNTVTFGGVETFAATNSTSGSTPGALTEGIACVAEKKYLIFPETYNMPSLL